MNRRGFLKNVSAFISGYSILPTRIISYDPVKQKVLRRNKNDNTFINGYKGSQFLENGIVWAPYISLIKTPNFNIDKTS